MKPLDKKGQDVQSYLLQNGFVPQNFSCPTPSSHAAAQAIGCHIGKIAKSILLMVGNRPVLVVTSGDTKVKSGRLKKISSLSGRVTFPEKEEVILHTGYPPGSVSPFLLPENLVVFLDNSLRRFDIIYPAAGTESSLVPMTFSQLQKMTCGHPADVCDIQ